MEIDMDNPNNCEMCDYKKLNANREKGHCCMLKTAPTEVCMQHTGRKIDIGKLVREWDTKLGTGPLLGDY